MRVLFTGAEAKKKEVPFLIDDALRPVTSVNAWLRSRAYDGATASLDTLRTYAYEICDFFKYLEANNIGWECVTNDTLTHYADVQDQNRSEHTKDYLSRRTINARILTVGRFYRFAFEEGLIAKNPIRYKAKKFHLPKDVSMYSYLGITQERIVPLAAYERVAKPRIKWLPHQEVMEWLNSIEVWSEKLLAKLLYRTGMRRKEIIDLQVWQLPERESVDLSRTDVPVRIVGKGRKARLIYLAVRDFIELHDYINTFRRQALRRTRETHDFIFVGNTGHPLAPHDVNRLFARISKLCKIKITPHMLRHSFAITALKYWKSIGVSQPEKLLQQRLGHSSIATTQIYMDLTDEDKAEEALANATLIDVLLKGEA
jgi:site-specific recombinase XerD